MNERSMENLAEKPLKLFSPEMRYKSKISYSTKLRMENCFWLFVFLKYLLKTKFSIEDFYDKKAFVY
jgi:hypothetical protein